MHDNFNVTRHSRIVKASKIRKHGRLEYGVGHTDPTGLRLERLIKISRGQLSLDVSILLYNKLKLRYHLYSP